MDALWHNKWRFDAGNGCVAQDSGNVARHNRARYDALAMCGGKRDFDVARLGA
jgi:hypothetical protein